MKWFNRALQRHLELMNPLLFLFLSFLMLSSTGITQNVSDSQKQAVAKYPELAQDGSPLHSKFIELYRQAKESNPALLQNPDWPITLADKAFALLTQPPPPKTDEATHPKAPIPTAPAGLVEFAKGEVNRFTTKQHAKAKGASFTMRYPKSWRAAEGERPNIVQKFISPGGLEFAMIITKALPVPAETKVTLEDAAEIVSPKELRESVPTNGRFINAKATKIEGEPAGILEYTMIDERAGMTVISHVVAISFLQGTTMIQVVFNVGGLAGATDDVATRAAAYRPLFDQMMNSIVFDDKWK